MTREAYQKEYLESFIREEYDSMVWADNLFTDHVKKMFNAGIQCADTMPKPGLVDLSKVWHDTKEEPETSRKVVAINEKGILISGVYLAYDAKGYILKYSGVYWNGGGCMSGARLLDWQKAIKWAYIENLLPKGGDQ